MLSKIVMENVSTLGTRQTVLQTSSNFIVRNTRYNAKDRQALRKNDWI